MRQWHVVDRRSERGYFYARKAHLGERPRAAAMRDERIGTPFAESAISFRFYCAKSGDCLDNM